MRSVKMIPTEEETEEQAELFSDMMQTIANEWDPYINNLKKSLPLNPDEIKEVQKKKDEMFTELDYIFCLDKSSPIVDLVLKLGRKLRYDCNFFRYYYRDHGIQPARAEQYTTAIILADLEAIEKPHPEEDNEDSDEDADVLDAPPLVIANTEDGHDVAAPLDEPSLVEATLQPQTIAKAAIPMKEGGRTKKKRRSRKKPRILSGSSRIQLGRRSVALSKGRSSPRLCTGLFQSWFQPAAQVSCGAGAAIRATAPAFVSPSLIPK